MAKVLHLSRIRNGGPFYIRAEYVVSVENGAWLGDDDEWHDGALLTVLTGNSFTVAETPGVVLQAWLAALGE